MRSLNMLTACGSLLASAGLCLAPAAELHPGLEPAPTVALADPAPAEAKKAADPEPVSTQPIANLSAANNVAGASLWFNAEYLLWWTKAQPLPVPVLSTGVLGQPGTAVLLGGGDPFDPGLHHGGRFTLGTTLGDPGVGIEGSYFFLAQQSENQVAGSSGTPDSFRTFYPFANVSTVTGVNESGLVLAIPGNFSSGTVLTMSTFLQGAEVNGVFGLRSSNRFNLSLITGFRFMELKEDLELFTLSPAVPPTPQNDYAIIDHFETCNQFYGGQIGLRAEWIGDLFFANASAKIALGAVSQQVNVEGLFRRTTAAQDLVTLGGWYAQPTNIGKQSECDLAWVPEVTLTTGVRLTSRITATVGYNFLCMTNVVRPGDQIDRQINTTQVQAFGPSTLVGPALPAVPFKDSAFWAQGINLGLQIRY